ncbi:MAG: choice-of-anchor E domain-containing protein [Methylococcales bacterium]|nr:choice-of-anchor E domain-containing protein [Methylococcales bacterium]
MLSSNVNAASESFTYNYGAADNLQKLSTYPIALNITDFDTSLGTLESVTVSYTGNIGVTVNGDNPDPTIDNIHLTLGGLQQFTSTAFSGTLLLNISADTDNVSIPAATTTDGTFTNSYSGQNTAGTTFSLPTTLTGFESSSPGTWVLNASASGTSGFSGGNGDDTVGFKTTEATAVTVTYNYTNPSISSGSAIPEPTSIALLASGLLGFGFRRKNRA